MNMPGEGETTSFTDPGQFLPCVPNENPLDRLTTAIVDETSEQLGRLHASPDKQGRVEFVRAGAHSIGNKEVYVAIRKYSTHAEYWSIMETDIPKDEDKPYLHGMGFRDREGNWWFCSHYFMHTNHQADENMAKEIQDGLESHTWSAWNFWYAEL